ncbi:Ser-Thr-rich glycosyl-phosphatidyl-inositol-anchored membrane family-domain-containing protein [Exophiala viscosa]|uniref:Ser-Thr-rich glycosyl-phosphatidyl-inositol-anchored membrane family-domain-containing protein n=1 Tax=Exophiala viscosa TaxID=2486360 RepID=A0AAN6E104_9EURO|nr:Ser-Thr-rich glycosyl-phosphatidyl-inositol-anchored membrane family-domain-containing protein [Exophiala viscosa]KAI1624025.1 Ser-Thr-rich glycosyl-phosphatidyl-inositol-anchored membrane family-domain-containing protein [Exophiala viscosa]
MHSAIVIAAAGLASLAQAYTTPGAQTWGPLLTPDTSDPVTQGQTALVTWDPESHPTDGVTVSLVLCHGPSTNCVDASTAIASGIPAAQKSYSWDVPCDLAAGTQNTDTGYGMLIIVDGTGEYQFSTQFSVLANSSCGSGSSSSSSSASSSSSSASASVVTSSASTTTSSASSTSSGSLWGSTTKNHSLSSTSTSSSGSASETTTTSAASGSSAASTETAASSTVVVSGTSTYTVVASGTTTFASATQASTTSSAPASTFTGGAAPQAGLSGAGLIIAGAFAVLAM